jgi:N-acetylmuramic acid 6-phosphate etherase
MEAAEARPTFGVPPDTVLGLIAGGPEALMKPREGIEDDAAAGREAIVSASVDSDDVVVGVSASGRTPYVTAAVEEAARRGALTIAVACDTAAPLVAAAELAIVPLVGPEVIAGSTRLKAGTAQKLVLNSLTTAVMARLGRVYGNLMLDVRASNEKLRRRAHHIVAQLTGRDDDDVRQALLEAGWSARVASVMLARGVDAATARGLLASGRSFADVLDVSDDG